MSMSKEAKAVSQIQIHSSILEEICALDQELPASGADFHEWLNEIQRKDGSIDYQAIFEALTRCQAVMCHIVQSEAGEIDSEEWEQLDRGKH